MSASDHLNQQQFLFHVSPRYNKESILSQGLNPNAPQNEWGGDQPTKIPRHVYLMPSPSHAHTWGTQIELLHHRETPMSLFKVDVSGLNPERKMTDMGMHEYTVPQHIEPTRISHVEDFNP